MKQISHIVQASGRPMWAKLQVALELHFGIKQFRVRNIFHFAP